MPTYEYVCDACGHEFELFQSMSAPVKRKCPDCSKLKLKRLIGTGSGIIFKGSGFYETDYKRKGSPDSTPKEDSQGKTVKSAEPKTEKKASSDTKMDTQQMDQTK